MKNLLILSGGGLRVAYQLGALLKLAEEGVTFDAVMGTSGGAINASFIAMNDLKGLRRLLASTVGDNELLFKSDYIDVNSKKLKWRAVWRRLKPKIGLGLLTKKGRAKASRTVQSNLDSLESVANAIPLKALLDANLDINRIKIPFYCNFTSLYSGEEVLVNNKQFTSSEEFSKCVLASATIPLFLPPQDVNIGPSLNGTKPTYKQCVDGGISSNVLIGKAFSFIKDQDNPGEWNIIVINCDDGKLKPTDTRGLLNILTRSVMGVMLTTLFRKDVTYSFRINELVKGKEFKDSGYISTPIVVIEPKGTQDLGGILDNTKLLFHTRMVYGAINASSQISKLVNT
jgi:predicted acylesterase/phospholipase RssA